MESILAGLACLVAVIAWIHGELRMHDLAQRADRQAQMLTREISRHRQAIYELQQARLNNKRLPPSQRPLTLVPPRETDR